MRAILALALSFVAFAPAASAQEATARKPVAVVVRISTAPLFTPDGKAEPDRDERLERLTSALDALNDADLASVPIALAPSVVLCDEAMHFRVAAARDFVRAIRRLATRAPVLVTPFANVRLPDLDRHSAGRELRAGRTTLARCTRTTPAAVMYPPAFALNDTSVAAARAEGVTAVLSDAVDVPTTSNVTLLPARDVPKGDTPAALIARTPEAVASVVVADLRTVDVPAYVRALQREERLELRTLASLRAPDDTGDVEFRLTDPPPASYRRALSQADRAFDRFSSMTTSDNQTTDVYRDLLARARSTADGAFADAGRRADQIVTLVRAAERGVRLGAATVTFTSRRGSVPVTVINRNPYPVRVRVAVSSLKLDFPDGASRVVEIAPPADRITFAAVARSTGTFPMDATVSSGDSSFEIDRIELTVRSTAANVAALALTIGGAVLLIFFSTRRKRKTRAP
jgi:hypothetical protein